MTKINDEKTHTSTETKVIGIYTKKKGLNCKLETKLKSLVKKTHEKLPRSEERRKREGQNSKNRSNQKNRKKRLRNR